MWPKSQETADSVTFTQEILNAKLLFLCSIFSQRKYGDFAGFSQFSKNLFTFTNEILYRKLHFLYSLLVKLGVNVRKFRTKKNYSNFYYTLRKNKFCIQNGKKRHRDLFYTVHFFHPFSKVSICYNKTGKKNPKRIHIFFRFTHFIPLVSFYTTWKH